MKSYTDIEQSKKLAEILPLESADMGWYYSHNPNAARNQMWVGTKAENADIPCWSLAALLELLSFPNLFYNDGWNLYVTINDKIVNINDADNPIDAVFEMICLLKENGKI